jgi:hypothetical protein
MVAMDGQDALQVPPDAEFVSVVVPEPLMARLPSIGGSVMVITDVATSVPQLLVTLYDTVAVPALTPVTIPVLPIVAFELLTLHVPPLTSLDNVMLAPCATVVGPEIVPAETPLTVTMAVTLLAPTV